MKLTHAKLIVMNKMVSYLFTGEVAMTVRELTVAVPAFLFIGLKDNVISVSQMDKLTAAEPGMNEKQRIIHYSKWLIRGLMEKNSEAKALLSSIANHLRKDEMNAIKHMKECHTFDRAESRVAFSNDLYEVFLGSHAEVAKLK